jgi:Cu(I)/Ag(I) efflux system membrane fusion protein
LDGGRFQPVEVKLGEEAKGKIVVLEGLREGQTVVASGQFLIDSEASLKGVLARQSEGGGESAAPQPTASATSSLNDADGKVESISGNEITLSHGPVKSLGWGAMTMPFQLARPNLAAGVKPGDHVHFGFRRSDGGYVIEQLSKTGSAP